MGFRIEDIELDYKVNKEELKAEVGEPIFIEGLLGVGHVGLLASTHLVKELRCKKIADVYSPHFNHPASHADIPGVVYSEDGMVTLNRNEIFYNKENNLFIYKGIYQADYCEFYYRHANKIMDFCEEFNVSGVYTLGGLGTGEEKENSEARAVITDPKTAEIVQNHVKILKGREDEPGVTGLSGLLIGLAHKNGITGISLLGETQGRFPDPKAAKSVLKALSGIIGFEVNLESLEKVTKKLEKKKKKIRKMLEWRRARRKEEEPEDLHYIG
ncbi:hypothetical protein AKJ58_01580 [candidate division MSBL1 archaeon SCGC-AAA385D11]|uniref:Proteasome assembly chaperone family protein n=1 Tax=candidate division MSBL1 archaeon SCGC-AAA385D11 TaxID=1698286 RepID=A0A133VN46_9EURY|nr:hypothetical protein AKJ58_01580 [candidate division MSBL1 archaeon SCGC-AAA385D11]